MCCLAWGGNDTLLVAWGCVVKLAVVMERSNNGNSSSGNKSLYAEVRHQFELAEYVCGLASAGSNNLGIITADQMANRATLVLCNHNGDIFHSSDIPGLQGAFPKEISFNALAPHLPMYVSAPRELIVLEMHDLLEHAMELMDHGDFEGAIRLANCGGQGVQGLCHVVCLKCILPDLMASHFEQACSRIGRFSSSRKTHGRSVS